MNEYAQRARMRKAIALEYALRQAGCADAGTVQRLDAVGRRMAEAIAGVRSCSDETWAMVVELFTEHDHARAVSAPW